MELSFFKYSFILMLCFCLATVTNSVVISWSNHKVYYKNSTENLPHDCPLPCYHLSSAALLAKDEYMSKCCTLWHENQCRMNPPLLNHGAANKSPECNCSISSSLCPPAEPANCAICYSHLKTNNNMITSTSDSVLGNDTNSTIQLSSGYIFLIAVGLFKLVIFALLVRYILLDFRENKNGPVYLIYEYLRRRVVTLQSSANTQNLAENASNMLDTDATCELKAISVHEECKRENLVQNFSHQPSGLLSSSTFNPDEDEKASPVETTAFLQRQHSQTVSDGMVVNNETNDQPNRCVTATSQCKMTSF